MATGSMTPGAMAIAMACLAAMPLRAAGLAPDPVLNSGVVMQIREVARPVAPNTGNNLAAPVVVDGRLHVVDQSGRIHRDRGGADFAQVLGPDDLPRGVTPAGRRAIMNIADGPGGDVYVALTSTTLPSGLTAAPLPSEAIYTADPPHYQIVYRYSQQTDGRLAAPAPLAAFEVRSSGHAGGGMLALDDGRILFATGDNLPFDRDGLAAPQDDGSHVSKMLLIDGQTGDVTVAAKGLRNVQRLTWADAARSRIAFADIGSTVAEEINEIPVADLVDTAEIENFGWGRDAGGTVREGTFHVADPGPGQPVAIGRAPVPEAGFRQPFAQFGREETGAFAVSGPVVSDSAFDTVTALFGDLVTGRLFATSAAFGSGTVNDVLSVSLVDEGGAPTSLFALAGERRADARFFNFADGGAGVLLEGTGTLYSMEQVAVPLPAGIWLLIGGLGALTAMRRARNDA